MPPLAPPATDAPRRGSIALATAVGGLLRFWWVLSAHWPASYLTGEMGQHVARAYALRNPGAVYRWAQLATHGLEALETLVLAVYQGGSVELLAPVQALLATAAIPLAAAGATRWFGRPAAAWTAWLLALDGVAIGIAGYFLPDGYATFCLALSFALLRPERGGAALASGLALALGGWFDPRLFTLVPLWTAALVCARREADGPGWRAAPLFLAGALLVGAPLGLAASRLGPFRWPGSPPGSLAWLWRQFAATFAGWPRPTADPVLAGGGIPWATASDLAITWVFLPLAAVELWRHRRRLGAWIGVGLPLAAIAVTTFLAGGGPQDRAPFDLFVLAAAGATLAPLAEDRWGRRLSACVPAPGPRRRLAVSLAVLVAAAVFLTLPLWLGPWFTSHEWDRYLARLVEYVRDWRDGSLFPRWCPDCYGGYGSPLFDFQPPGVFVPSAAWMLLGAAPTTALKLTLLLATGLGALGAFLLIRGETRRTDAALLGALAFSFAPYQFMNLFLRGDLSEVLALSFFPLTLFLYRECLRAPLGRLPWLGLAAAICHAGIVLSHTITGQWTTEILAISLLPGAIGALRRGEWRRLAAGFAILVAAMGLSAIYVVPALLEKKLVFLERITTGYFTATRHLVPAWRFFRFWFYEFVEDGFDGDKVRMPFSIGLPMILALAFAAVGLLRRRSRPAMRRALPWWAGFAAILWLMTPQAAAVWRHLPLASFIEFPWRLLGPASLLGAVALGATWAALVPPGRANRSRLTTVGALAIVAAGIPMQRVGGYLQPADLRLTPEGVQRPIDQGMTSADEHLPRTVRGVPSGPRKQLWSLSPGGQAAVRASQTGGTEYALHVEVRRAPADVDLAVNDFAGWRAQTSSGPAPVLLEPSPTGLVRLHLAAPGSYAIRVFFGGTPARTAGAAITLVCLLVLFPLLKLVGGAGEPAVRAGDACGAGARAVG